MKLEKIFLIFILVIITTQTVLAIPPTLALDTSPVNWVGYDSATLVGNVTTLDSISNLTIYFQYKKIGETNWTESVHINDIDSTGIVMLNVSNLDSNTNYSYYVVGEYIYEGDNIIEGDTTENFTTNTSPSIDYDSTTNLGLNGFTFNMNLTDLGGEDNVSVYVECYDDEDNLYTTNETLQTINETGEIQINVTGLESGTEYLCYGVVEFDFEDFIGQVYTENITIITTAEEDTIVTTGILNVQSLTYAAFALLVIIILVTIAMSVITLIQNGGSTNQLITLGIWAIGGAVLLFVGYIIVGAVVGSLL